ncbi:MAG: VOC family protein [Spirochaetaceae bacterium]|jgi:lactoylglutathione lyase|nr:VOC family protein [Spirochaetaceae bacterium]
MITRLGHIALRARDIEATAGFYRDVLGMKEAFRMYNLPGEQLGSVHIYVAPSQFIEIFPNGAEEYAPTPQTIGYSHLCFEVDDAAGTLEELRKRGAPIDTELKLGFSRCIQFWTHDPDGNRIEFMELPPDCLQTAANKRYSEESVRK